MTENHTDSLRFRSVALFIPSFAGGGAENVFVLLANHWISQGVEVNFLVCSEEGPMRSRLDTKVNVIILKNSGSRLLRRLSYARQISAYCSRYRPDLLLTTLTYCNQVATLAKKVWGLGNTQLVIREANSLANIKRKGGRMHAWVNISLMRKFYPAADWISANSENTLEELEVELGLPVAKWALVRNPVELHDIKEYLPKSQQKLILGCGRLIPQKDFITLLRAFAIVCREYECRLVILGEGPERAKLEALADELGIMDNEFELPGFVDQPGDYYRQASVCVLPSKWEGLPNVVLEALSYGVPTLATDCSGGTREIFEGIDGHFLVPVGDVDVMAERILAFLKNPPLPGAMQAILAGRYDISSVADAYVNLVTQYR